jgi:CHASE1-domain containing sensor protein
VAENNALKEKEPSFFHHLPAVWLLFVGLVLTAGAAAKTADWERRQIAGDFEKSADYVMDLLRDKMNSSLDVLLSIRSFYLASHEMEYGEFEKFTAPLLEQHSEIYALEWIPEIRGEDRDIFEKEAALKLGREYSLRDQAPDGSFFPLFKGSSIILSCLFF